jgi:hypothetical protein
MIRDEALRWFEEGNNDISTARILLDNKKYITLLPSIPSRRQRKF